MANDETNINYLTFILLCARYRDYYSTDTDKNTIQTLAFSFIVDSTTNSSIKYSFHYKKKNFKDRKYDLSVASYIQSIPV